jgi:uncharacterized membrane protein YraQ (UPF0718 family)
VQTVVNAVIESLLIGLGFFYKALWPILFGVLITAAVETLVDQDNMARILGGRDLVTTGKATIAGAVSSACTFGAVTITHTLFKKGASSESSFAFASTNLVFELGILIYVLLGPAFLAAELLGGFLLIAVMYLLVRLTLPEKAFEEARQRLRREEGDSDSGPLAFSKGVSSGGDWRSQLASREGWYRIAKNYFHTIGRIYKTVIWGFLLAGLIVGLLPDSFWRSLFLEPSSFFGVAENATLGVLAGVLSFIGSIGNVPFAAALWASGVSFAGVIVLIYADLITIPVLGLWKKCLGWKAMLYVFAVFFVTMLASAVAMEYLFAAFGWIPGRTGSQDIKSFLAVKLDFTLVMTVVMLALTAVLYRVVRVVGDRENPEESG